MKHEIFVENEGDIEATIRITMNLSQWEELMRQLEKKFPSYQLASAISDLLFRFRKTIRGEKEN